MGREARRGPVKHPSRFDGDRRERFLAQLRRCGVVALAADAAGISRSQAYRTREGSAAFREAWDTALEDATDGLEAEARRRALEGWDRPVFYQGQCVGAVREYSDPLLMFLLKAHRPDRFRERVPSADDQPVTVKILRFSEDPAPESDGTPRAGGTIPVFSDPEKPATMSMPGGAGDRSSPKPGEAGT